MAWKLPASPPGGTKTVTLKLRAAAAGDGLLRTIAQAGRPSSRSWARPAGAAPAGAAAVLEAKAETAIKAEGVAAVRFEVIDLEDPVEVGKEAMYEIRVTNQGTGPAPTCSSSPRWPTARRSPGSSGPTQVKAQGQHARVRPDPDARR